MVLVTDNETLLKFIPNTMTTVEGESSMFDKISPWLEIAELWLKQKILGASALTKIPSEPDSEECQLSRRIVVNTAFKTAIPNLDVILTPNGFGIVSNQNVAPASKERVERLIASISSTRDSDVEALLDLLPAFSEWHESQPWRFWSRTLFPNITVCRQVPAPAGAADGGSYERYFQLQPSIIQIEERMAEEFLSEELLDLLRYKLSTAQSELSDEEKHVIKLVRSEIINMLNGNPPCHRTLVGVVDYIRKRPEEFPLWHSSETAKLFSPPVFENDKKKCGYFF